MNVPNRVTALWLLPVGVLVGALANHALGGALIGAGVILFGVLGLPHR